MTETVAVVKLYGINLGSQETTKKQEELEAYWEKCASKHPDVRMGWFGPHQDPLAILYHKLGFHEMFDAGAINKSSCIVSGDDVKAFHKTWDPIIMEAVEDMGFKNFDIFDVGWQIVVTTFPPEDYEIPQEDLVEDLIQA